MHQIKHQICTRRTWKKLLKHHNAEENQIARTSVTQVIHYLSEKYLLTIYYYLESVVKKKDKSSYSDKALFIISAGKNETGKK